MEDVQVEIIECPPPTTVFDPWGIHTFLPDADGQPLSLKYTLDYPKPHRLSIVDIDAQDTQMAVYVNDILRGITGNFELNKTKNCGEDVRTCLLGGFSAGMTVVRPGQEVRIEWIGKGQLVVFAVEAGANHLPPSEDYIPGTDDIEWGKKRSRRIM
jgi:hypothetical protein